jgi:hemoglobin-like flavoprotein
MALSSNQVRLVRDSFKQLMPKSDAVAEAFYNRLFELDPSLKTLFHTDMREQGSKLLEAIGIVVENLDRFPAVEQTVRNLAERHVGYGVKGGDYDVVGEALLWAIERTLAPNFSSETKDAWAATYLLLASSMKAATTSAPS